MTLAELIEVRDALAATKQKLHELSLNEIDIKGGLYDQLKSTIDKTYWPLVNLDLFIESKTQQMELNND